MHTVKTVVRKMNIDGHMLWSVWKPNGLTSFHREWRAAIECATKSGRHVTHERV